MDNQIMEDNEDISLFQRHKFSIYQHCDASILILGSAIKLLIDTPIESQRKTLLPPFHRKCRSSVTGQYETLAIQE